MFTFFCQHRTLLVTYVRSVGPFYCGGKTRSSKKANAIITTIETRSNTATLFLFSYAYSYVRSFRYRFFNLSSHLHVIHLFKCPTKFIKSINLTCTTHFFNRSNFKTRLHLRKIYCERYQLNRILLLIFYQNYIQDIWEKILSYDPILQTLLPFVGELRLLRTRVELKILN